MYRKINSGSLHKAISHRAHFRLSMLRDHRRLAVGRNRTNTWKDTGRKGRSVGTLKRCFPYWDIVW